MEEITKDTWTQAITFPISEALEYQCVMPIIENWKNKKILDFGCGSGRDDLVLAKNGVDIYCVDIIQSNLDYAKELFKINNVKGEFKLIKEKDKIPYPDDFFDGINCNGVLHHIPHVEDVLTEFRRVLKSGGIMYIMLYTEVLFKLNLNEIENMIKNQPEKTWQRCFGEITDKCNYSNFYTLIGGINLFKSKGFKIIDVKSYHNYQFRIFKLENLK